MYTFANKPTVYEGQFRQNKYHGKGTMWWYQNRDDLEKQNKTKAGHYNGDWENNEFHGNGTYFWPAKGQTFRGSL